MKSIKELVSRWEVKYALKYMKVIKSVNIFFNKQTT